MPPVLDKAPFHNGRSDTHHFCCGQKGHLLGCGYISIRTLDLDQANLFARGAPNDQVWTSARHLGSTIELLKRVADEERKRPTHRPEVPSSIRRQVDDL